MHRKSIMWKSICGRENDKSFADKSEGMFCGTYLDITAGILELVMKDKDMGFNTELFRNTFISIIFTSLLFIPNHYRLMMLSASGGT